MAYKDRSGEIHNGFLLVRRVPGKSNATYEVRCVHCGYERTYAINTIRNGTIKCPCIENGISYCRECGKAFPRVGKKVFCCKACCDKYQNKLKKKKTEEYVRKVTKTTRMLVCVYTAEGMSIEAIAELLKRPENVIKKILKNCKGNGVYKKYVENSPILQIRRRRCT